MYTFSQLRYLWVWQEIHIHEAPHFLVNTSYTTHELLIRPRLQDVFIVKEHRFLDIYSMRLQENSENNSKNANEMESKAYQKRNETVFMYTQKNEKMILAIGNDHVTIPSDTFLAIKYLPVLLLW